MYKDYIFITTDDSHFLTGDLTLWIITWVADSAFNSCEVEHTEVTRCTTSLQ